MNINYVWSIRKESDYAKKYGLKAGGLEDSA